MTVVYSEILPGLDHLFEIRQPVLRNDRDTVYLWVAPGEINVWELALIEPSLVCGMDEEWDAWQTRFANRNSNGRALFWECPSIPQYALVRLRLNPQLGLPSWGRRAKGNIRTGRSLSLASRRGLSGLEDEGVATLFLPKGIYTVVLDEHFHWPDREDWLPLRDDQIMYTVNFFSAEHETLLHEKLLERPGT